MGDTAFWYIVVGGILLLMSLVSSRLERLPISSSIIYFMIGIALGPAFLNKLRIDFIDSAKFLEHVTEIAVIISVFAAGLKLKWPREKSTWVVSFMLATFVMVLCIAGIAVLGKSLLGLSWAVAILMGAILAPTDPVLASSISVKNESDQDKLRFNLTAEAGLNDGAAFPFVVLGIGLLGYHGPDWTLASWFLWDVLWAVTSAIAIGGGCGFLAAKVVTIFKKEGRANVVFEDLLSVGLLAITYGLCLSVHAYGFIAAFIVGVAFRYCETHMLQKGSETKDGSVPGTTKNVLSFNEQLERLVEFATVIVVGSVATQIDWSYRTITIALSLIFIIRPLSVLFGAYKRSLNLSQIALVSWFGVRGIGSIFYFSYAAHRALDHGIASTILQALLVTITISIFLHGITSGPLMRLYERANAKTKTY